MHVIECTNFLRIFTSRALHRAFYAFANDGPCIIPHKDHTWYIGLLAANAMHRGTEGSIKGHQWPFHASRLPLSATTGSFHFWNHAFWQIRIYGTNCESNISKPNEKSKTVKYKYKFKLQALKICRSNSESPSTNEPHFNVRDSYAKINWNQSHFNRSILNGNVESLHARPLRRSCQMIVIPHEFNLWMDGKIEIVPHICFASILCSILPY